MSTPLQRTIFELQAELDACSDVCYEKADQQNSYCASHAGEQLFEVHKQLNQFLANGNNLAANVIAQAYNDLLTTQTNMTAASTVTDIEAAEDQALAVRDFLVKNM